MNLRTELAHVTSQPLEGCGYVGDEIVHPVDEMKEVGPEGVRWSELWRVGNLIDGTKSGGRSSIWTRCITARAAIATVVGSDGNPADGGRWPVHIYFLKREEQPKTLTEVEGVTGEC